jgi:hypothetical protein
LKQIVAGQSFGRSPEAAAREARIGHRSLIFDHLQADSEGLNHRLEAYVHAPAR